MALQKIPGRAIQLDAQANSDVMYFDGTDWVRLEKGDDGDILTVNEDATAPQWGPSCLFTGTQTGYACGGHLGSSGGHSNAINKFSLVTDGNATDIGDLTTEGRFASGHSSSTHGYVSGGNTGPTVSYNVIERFSFTTDGDATDWADLISARTRLAPVSSCTHGFTLGGGDEWPLANLPSVVKSPISVALPSVTKENLLIAFE
jgi:hypothetical protein